MADHDHDRDDTRNTGNTNAPTNTGKPSDTPATGPGNPPDPRAGMDKEVGDLEDEDAVREDGALPGRMGGGLAGG